MLPDNLMGSLVMTLINMTVVFLVLGFLALVIEAVHRLISRLQPEGEEAPRRQVLVVSSHSELQEGEMFLPDDIDPIKKAAILAAITVYMGRPETSMFLRDRRNSGAWGGFSGRQAYGRPGSYRSGQLTKERQPVGYKK